MEDTKKCPYCGEEIRSEAIRCRYCRSRLTSFDADRWHRSHPDVKIAGVSVALARAFAIPVSLIRVVFVVLTFVHFLGPLIYAGLWLIIPKRPGAESPLEGGLQWALDFAGNLSRHRDEPPRGPSSERPARPSSE